MSLTEVPVVTAGNEHQMFADAFDLVLRDVHVPEGATTITKADCEKIADEFGQRLGGLQIPVDTLFPDRNFAMFEHSKIPMRSDTVRPAVTDHHAANVAAVAKQKSKPR